MTKNVLFVAHHNNDFDHFLPIIINSTKYNVDTKTIVLFNKHDVLKNRLHEYICDSNNIELDSIITMCYFKFINTLLIKIYEYILNYYKFNETNIYGHNSWFKKFTIKIKNLFLNAFEWSIIRYFVIISIFLLNKNRIINYIKSNEIKLAIIDHRMSEESSLNSNSFKIFRDSMVGKNDPLNYVLFRFLKIIREASIPIIMIPHGPQPVSENIPEEKVHQRSIKIKNSFRPDYLILSSKNDLSVQSYKNILGLKSTVFLGDPRFDICWIEYLEECALKVYSNLIEKKSDKIVLLYLMDIFVYDYEDNENYKFQLNKDILSLVNYFPNLEIWVKHHPRKKFKLNIEEFIDKDKQNNIRQFGNDVDTNILLAKSDIVIAMSSTMFIQPIVQKKPVIFYQRWKEKLNTVTTIFDNIEFKASSQEELINQCKRILNNEYKIDEREIKKIYKNVFSFDFSSKSMIEKYMEKINEVLREKNSIS